MGNIADSLNNYWKVANKPHQEDATIHVTGAEKSAWNGKQDALRGTQGQIVGFDADGKPEAQDAPATGVTSFNGRSGAVSPRPGDYSAEDVGADPAGSADAVQGNLTSHAGNASHISVEEREAWNAKENGGAAAAVQGNLNAHTGDTNNPHDVTAAQAGAIPAPSESGSAGQVLMLDEDGKTPIWGTVSGGGSLKLDCIYVDTQPSKTAYKAGEAFSPAGMVVKADYSLSGVVIARGVEVTGYSYPMTRLIAGQTSVTITYAEGGASMSVDVKISVTKTIVPIPTYNGKLTYTGEAQTPTFTNDPGELAVRSGDTSGTDAGDYKTRFDLPDPDTHEWGDGSAGYKEVNWSILPAAQTVSCSPNTLALTNSEREKSFAVSRRGTGEITAVSSDLAVATVRIDGETVTVTAVDSGSCTINVSVAAGNYEAGAASVSVTADVYPSTLAKCTPKQIQELSKAGTLTSLYPIGSKTAEIKLSGTIWYNGKSYYKDVDASIALVLIGYDHNKERENPSAGDHAAHFEIGWYKSRLTALQTVRMNNTATNAGGWKSSAMKTQILTGSGTPSSPTSDTLMAMIPKEWRDVMRTVTKYSENTGNGSTSAGTVTSTAEYLCLASKYEYDGEDSNPYYNPNEQTYQKQYAYYANGNRKDHYGDEDQSWVSVWTRSSYKGNNKHFCMACASQIAADADTYTNVAMSPILFV